LSGSKGRFIHRNSLYFNHFKIDPALPEGIAQFGILYASRKYKNTKLSWQVIMFSKLKAKLGFTLIEMMTTVVIIGIAAALVAPGFDRAAKRVEFKGQTKDIVSILRTARSNAIAEKNPFGIYFDDGAGQLVLFKEMSSPLNTQFELGTDSAISNLQFDTNAVWFYTMFSNNSVVFQPNGSASETGDIYMNYDNGEVYCNSSVSVLASTGRSKLEYFYTY